MKVEGIGHACFRIISQTGLKIITDPYESGFCDIIKYSPIKESADIVTVSHDHGDHNYVSAVSGTPLIVKSPKTTRIKGIEFKGIPVYHDRVGGAERGANIIFVFEVDDIRLTHLEDLGHPLSSQQLRELEGTEVLFASTGRPVATLELQEVVDLWEGLKPRIVIPMHFRTARCTFPKYGGEDLIRLRLDAERVGASEVFLTRNRLPTPTQILVLEPLL